MTRELPSIVIPKPYSRPQCAGRAFSSRTAEKPIVFKEPEDYTSQTCCMCGTICKSNRVHRGLYVCKQCGAVINADVNGAINILKRYLPGQIGASWSSGCLAQPAVNRFAWRETRPSASAHKPGTWQTSLPHPRTESAAALSGFRA